MNSKKRVLVGALLFLMTAPTSAWARKVFLNGVDLDGVYLVNVTFKNCIVRVDAKGNIHITAPGYEIKPVDEPAPANARRPPVASPGVATDYYLVSFTNRPGATQYDVEVFINGKFVRRIRSSDRQVVMRVTHLLKPGKNEILFVSRKNYGGGRRISTSPVDYLRVVIGRGFMSKGRLVIKTADAEVRRTAAEDKAVIYDKRIIVVK